MTESIYSSEPSMTPFLTSTTSTTSQHSSNSPSSPPNNSSSNSSLYSNSSNQQHHSFLPPLPFSTYSTGPTSISLDSLTNSLSPSIIQFDPKATPSDDEEYSEEEQDLSLVQGRPKKRKSVANLRNVAINQSTTTSTTTNSIINQNKGINLKTDFAQLDSTNSRPNPIASTSNNNVMIEEEDEREKGRRKIHIEYIEEKSKRHITFSKRKAGIMKKVGLIRVCFNIFSIVFFKFNSINST